MVGTDAKDNPDPTGIPVNYAFYNTKSEAPAALSNASSNSSDWGSFAGLSGKEWVFLGICAVISTVVPEVGVPLAEQYVVRTLLVKLGTNVVIDYAVDLGYNKAAAQANPQAAAAYVANMVKAYQSAYNSGKPNVQVSINGGSVESLNTAIEAQNGLNLDLHGSNVKEYIDRYKSLSDEIGLNKTTLANDAYLGTQILNDPTKTGQAASFNASITPNTTSSSFLTSPSTSGQTAGTPQHAVTHHVKHHCPPDEPEPATRPAHHRSGA